MLKKKLLINILAANCSSINHSKSNGGREEDRERDCLKPLAFLPLTQKIFRQPIQENV